MLSWIFEPIHPQSPIVDFVEPFVEQDDVRWECTGAVVRAYAGCKRRQIRSQHMPERHFIRFALRVMAAEIVSPKYVIALRGVNRATELILELLVHHIRNVIPFGELLIRGTFDYRVKFRLRIVLFSAESVLQWQPDES